MPCQAHVFGAAPFQRKAVKKHIESRAHQRAVRAAAEAEAEEAAAQARVRRIDAQALAAEAKRFASPLSGELPARPAPRTFVDNSETLREREMWERFEVEGFEQTLFHDNDDDNGDEDEFIDIALRRRLETVNLGITGPTESSPFYDDGDETITNVMREIGNAVYSVFTIVQRTEFL